MSIVNSSLHSEKMRILEETAKVYKPRLKKSILQRVIFSIRAVNAWNALPEEFISVSTVNEILQK